MYLRLDQLKGIPFKHIGKDVRISDKCSIYNPENISIGDNTRIDDFTILSAGEGGIIIGKKVHIGCHSTLIGELEIRIGDYTELSGRVSVYSSTNDFTCKWYWDNEDERDNIITGNVDIQQGCVIGCGSVVLPAVTIGQYARVGALSLVKKDIPAMEVWVGIPVKKLFDL
jgi:dTDP-4-amino-4,6-dideoxy-D-glucose acyltransferase